MDENNLRNLLQGVQTGRIDLDAAVESLKSLPFEALADGGAMLDTHRTLRQGIPEVVYGEGKTEAQVVDIAGALLGAQGRVLVTRVDAGKGAALKQSFPDGILDPVSRTFRAGSRTTAPGILAIVTAGTSDRAVAEEAAVSAEFLGHEARRIYDVGVAGLHRLAARRAEIESAQVVIAIAGMEGALASVIGGLISRPVIAVPTSVGYGASFGGLSALLAMLTSCAAGITVVNIDNGFGAAVAASKIARLNA